jgi:hypothetical protein
VDGGSKELVWSKHGHKLTAFVVNIPADKLLFSGVGELYVAFWIIIVKVGCLESVGKAIIKRSKNDIVRHRTAILAQNVSAFVTAVVGVFVKAELFQTNVALVVKVVCVDANSFVTFVTKMVAIIVVAEVFVAAVAVTIAIKILAKIFSASVAVVVLIACRVDAG